METFKSVVWPVTGVIFYVIFVILFQFGPSHFAEGFGIQFSELTGKAQGNPPRIETAPAEKAGATADGDAASTQAK